MKGEELGRAVNRKVKKTKQTLESDVVTIKVNFCGL